ncbi:MAG: N-acetylmuramoyl-L-alanine amidase-like domain-containing protein [Ignavibacteria bacterium]
MIRTKIMYINKFYSSLILALILMFVSANTFADDEAEIKAVKKKLKSFDASLGNSDISEIIAAVGKTFVGVEYVAGTLDKNVNDEKLVIKITGLDCVTYVENVLAIATVIKKGTVDFASYKTELQNIRYRNGEINGYPSRLHYYTDWIYNNQEKGYLKDITQDIGGELYSKKINFMSTHTDSYKQLTGNEDFINEIKSIEKSMNKRRLYYIKKGEVDQYYDQLQTGDIIATTTNIEGLDVTHTGFIYKEKGKTKFMHASITKGEIIISKEELKEYLKGNKKQTGIIVARPL